MQYLNDWTRECKAELAASNQQSDGVGDRNPAAPRARIGDALTAANQSLRLRRLMADNVSLDRAWAALNANRPTPNATIEAVKQSVRDRGLAALKETVTRARLAGFDAAARTELDTWLTHFKARVF